MPEENVEIVRRNHDAWSRGDPDCWLDFWAPDAVVDWSNSQGLDDPVEIDEGLVLVENVTYFRGRDGIEVHARSGWLFAVRDGAITSLTLYQTKGDALEAVGLSE